MTTLTLLCDFKPTFPKKNADKFNRLPLLNAFTSKPVIAILIPRRKGSIKLRKIVKIAVIERRLCFLSTSPAFDYTYLKQRTTIHAASMFAPAPAKLPKISVLVKIITELGCARHLATPIDPKLYGNNGTMTTRVNDPNVVPIDARKRFIGTAISLCTRTTSKDSGVIALNKHVSIWNQYQPWLCVDLEETFNHTV